ncbi:MAG: hypothetical protein ABIJ12_01095 [bacterium]
MKAFIILAGILLLCFGLVYADGVTVSHVNGGWDNDTKVTTGRPVTWYIRMDTPPSYLYSFTNGFRVFISSDGTVGGLLNPGPGLTPISWETIGDLSAAPTYSVQPFGVDGLGADTIGFGSPGPFTGHFPDIHEDMWTITTQVENSTSGNYLCIDSSWSPPGSAWLWYVGQLGTIIPSWDGPHCYLIEPCCQGIRGDVVGSEGIFIDDLMYLRDFLFFGGSAPDCLKAGDVTLDDQILVNDLVMLVNYLFKGGETPPMCD